MLSLKELSIKGVFSIENFIASDSRGKFLKTYHEMQFKEAGLETEFKESYYTSSKRDVIRGLHFQEPPFDHNKLVYCVAGKVLDVIVDLRAGSPTFKQVCSVSLEAFGTSVYIPKGCGHGFLSLQNGSLMVYNVSTVYNSKFDNGVLWNSIDFEWDVLNPIISERDKSFSRLQDFQNPFL